MKEEKKGDKLLSYFSESKVALLRELKNHPKLLGQIASSEYFVSKEEDWPDILGVIAAHMFIEVDETFNPEQIGELEYLLFNSLAHSRMINVR